MTGEAFMSQNSLTTIARAIDQASCVETIPAEFPDSDTFYHGQRSDGGHWCGVLSSRQTLNRHGEGMEAAGATLYSSFWPFMSTQNAEIGFRAALLHPPT